MKQFPSLNVVEGLTMTFPAHAVVGRACTWPPSFVSLYLHAHVTRVSLAEMRQG